MEPEVADQLSDYKEIFFDRTKYFKSDYESLPIPDLDIEYFHKQNTIDMMEYSTILGALFISYQRDIYILEKENIVTFFQKDERKVMKKIPILKPDEPMINMIKLSSCSHMLAIAAGNEIRVYSIKDMITQGTANLLSTYYGEDQWEYLRWAPQYKDTKDILVGVTKQKKLHYINFQTGESKSTDAHEIVCANFSRDLEHIVAITYKHELIIFSKDLVPTRIDKLEFIEEENAEATVLTTIEEPKPDLWLIQGAWNDTPEEPSESSRHTYMVQGNIVAKKITELKVQFYPSMFMPLFGADMTEFLNPYYRTVYIQQRDVFLSGNSEGMVITMIVGNKRNLPETDPKRYAQLESDTEGLITLKTPLAATGKLARLRGFAFYTNKLSDRDLFEYLENDEEKTMPYPPFVIVLTSCGQLAKYGFVDKRAAFSNDKLLIDTLGPQALKRTLQLKSFKNAAAPVISIPKPVEPELPSVSPSLSLNMSMRAATDGDAGIIDPHAAKFKETKKRVKNKITLLNSAFQELAEGIKQIVIEPLKAEDKEFYAEWREIETNRYKCKEFIGSSKLFLIKQKRFNEYFQGLLVELSREAGMIKEIITDQVLEGEEIQGYKNNELSLEINKCKSHFDSFSKKLKYIKEFCQTYTNLKGSLTVDLPENSFDSSSLVFSIDTVQKAPKEPAVHNRRDISLNLEPVSKGLKMSTSLRTPEQPSSRLIKSGQGPNLGWSAGLSKPKISTKPINLNRTGIPLTTSVVKPAEPEYRRQLADIHRKLKDALQHSIQEINIIKTTLNGLQDNSLATPTPVAHPKASAEIESPTQSKRKPRSRMIRFPENDDELGAEADGEACHPFFANLLEKAQATKLNTVVVPAFPFKRYDNYKGPKLIDLFAHFQKNYPNATKSTNILSSTISSQQTQFKQVFQPTQDKRADLSAKQPSSLLSNKTTAEDLKDKKTGFMDFSLQKKDSEIKAETKPAGGLFPAPTDKPKGAPSSIFNSGAPTTGEAKPTQPSSLFGGGIKKEEAKVPEKDNVSPPKEKGPAASIFNMAPAASGDKPKTGAASSLFGGNTAGKDKPAEAPKKEEGSIFGSNIPAKGPTDAQKAAAPSSLFGANIANKDKPAEDKDAATPKKEASIFGSNIPAKGPTDAQKAGAPSSLFGANIASKDKPAEGKEKEAPAPPKKEASIFGSNIPKTTEQTNVQKPTSSLFGANIPAKKEEEKKDDNVSNGSSSFITSDDEGKAGTGAKPKGEKKENKDKDILSQLPGVKLASNFSFASPDAKKEQPAGKKDFLSDLISGADEDDDLIPAAPALVRDDSYLQKPEAAPKFDMFKTMSGRPPFLPPKGGAEPKKEDTLAQLREFKKITDNKTVTLFSKKIDDKPKLSTVEEKKEEEPTVEKSGANDDDLFSSLSIGQGKKVLKPEDKQSPAAAPIATTTKSPSLFGQPSQPANPTIAKPAPTSNWGNMFGVNKDQQQQQQPQPQSSGPTNAFGFGTTNNQQAGAKPNMFAISSNTGANSTGNAFGGHGGGGFGSHGGGGFGSHGGGFGSGGSGIAFGQGAPKLSQQSQQPPKLFGMGVGTNANANASQPSQPNQPSGFLFSSAVGQGSSFLSSGSNQPNMSFGGAGGMGTIRKTKQI